MKLWVRSQDKEKILPIDKPIVYDFSEFGSHRIVYKESASYVMNLGSYESKERVLEVLDEIQNILSCKCLLKSYDNLTPEFNNNLIIQPCEVHIEQLNDYVYEMPKE